jgi:polyisoprenoid-binding protein YceI
MRDKILLALVLAFAIRCADATPTLFTLNKDHTDVVFEVSHVGYSMKHGWFRDLSGTLSFDAGRLESSSVDISVKAASIDTNHTERDKDLSGPSFLDAAKFPYLHFVSRKVVRTGGQSLDIEGDLTLHGVTRPLVLHAHFNKLGSNPFDHVPTVGFTATATLMRSDFGIASMIPLIGDTVSMTIDAEFSEAGHDRR